MFAIVGHETSDSFCYCLVSRCTFLSVRQFSDRQYSSLFPCQLNEHNKFLLHKYLDRVLNIQTEQFSLLMSDSGGLFVSRITFSFVYIASLSCKQKNALFECINLKYFVCLY